MNLDPGFHFELKSPPWQKSEYSLVDPNVRLPFERDLLDWLKLFPAEMQKVNVQVIASYASGNAHLGGDIDILCAPTDDLADTFRNRWLTEIIPGRPDIIQALCNLQWKYGMLINVSFGLSAKGTFCYSITDQQWYGKKAGERIFKRTSFNKTTKVYEMYDYAPIPGRFKHRPFPTSPETVV